MTHRIQQIQQHFPLQIQNKTKPKTDVNFSDILSDVQKIKVSKHAQQRLTERNIQINDTLWQTIGEKMSEAKQKGVTDSLVVTNEAALLVSTTNNTVVTAMNREEATTRIFTNINGTILINE